MKLQAFIDGDRTRAKSVWVNVDAQVPSYHPR
jgi:hypothetical protein